MWKPGVQQFSTPIRVQRRQETKVNGAMDISYIDADIPLGFCNWKGRGGSESVTAGTVVVADTAELTLWYRPDITEKTRILLQDNVKLAYEVTNVENVEMRNQYMIVKVKRVVNG
ncbi:head-tail adaptor protein [Paenibacillus sp. FSL H7-0735]|uniref:phage head completion protein n=1 Tax=Paenibacillus sp. FSL H7-0735 TaxID=2954736 RepID=UPI0030FB2CDA